MIGMPGIEFTPVYNQHWYANTMISAPTNSKEFLFSFIYIYNIYL